MLRSTIRLRAVSALAFALLTVPVAAHAADQPKKTIAVGAFEGPELMNGGATGPGLAVMLVNALLKDGRFDVVERAALGEVQTEQALGRTGATTASTAAPTGQMIGASVLIVGTVTKFIPNAAGGSLSVGGIGSSNSNSLLGNIGSTAGVSDTTAEVEINIRLVDTASGRIIASDTATGSASSTGVNANIYTSTGMNVGGQAFLNTPLGKAAQDAIEDAVKKIDIGMENVPWSAAVVENDGGTVYINAGANRNMHPGMTLHVYRQVKQLIDPTTNAVLDTIFNTVGTIQVQNVSDKVSTCTVTSGTAPTRGDVLKLE